VATYRPIHISFWQDKFVLKLTPEQKYFYLYLMTNSKTKQCGVYELPKNVISFETGYNFETIDKLLQYFIREGKILYSEQTEEIIILNWIKYNPVTNINILKCVITELKEVKNAEFVKKFNKMLISSGYLSEHLQEDYKGLIRGLDTPCKKETKTESQSESKEKTESQSEKEIEFEKFWNLYNKKVGSKESVFKKFSKLSDTEIDTIFETLPKYIESTPDKQYRKNPETYINQKSWNDEIIIKTNNNGTHKPQRNTLQDFS